MPDQGWDRQFAAVVRRKTGEAASALLPPYRTTAIGALDGLHRIGSAWTRSLFDGDFYVSPARNAAPSSSLVFVQSLDGNTGTRNPSSLGGGLTDKHLIYEGLSRVAADGVLAGADTIRGSRVILSVWHPELIALRERLGRPRHPVQIVATLGALEFTDALLLNVPDLSAVVLAPAAWVERMRLALRERPWVTAIAMADPGDLPAAFRAMRSLGLATISVIGGRRVARALLDAGLVRDVYLTTSPRRGGEPDTPITRSPLGGALVVRKCGTGPEEGVVFEHLALDRGDGRSG